MQRWPLVLVLLLLASSAFGYINPIVTPALVKLHPGDTTTLALTTWWSGISAYPQHNLFTSDAPAVAEMSGSLSWVGDFQVAPVIEPIHVVAHTPGVAHVIDAGRKYPLATVIVECDPHGNASAVAVERVVTTTVQHAVTLEVSPNGFVNPSYDWFEGSTGDYRSPRESHVERSTAIFYAPGVFHVWAEVWDTCSYATVEFTINVVASGSRHRAIRH